MSLSSMNPTGSHPPAFMAALNIPTPYHCRGMNVTIELLFVYFRVTSQCHFQVLSWPSIKIRSSLVAGIQTSSLSSVPALTRHALCGHCLRFDRRPNRTPPPLNQFCSVLFCFFVFFLIINLVQRFVRDGLLFIHTIIISTN